MKKKILLCLFFIFIIICVCIVIILKTRDEDIDSKKENNIFRVSKIKYYSSCDASSNTTSYQNPEWNLKVYQYTDIAIYLQRLDNVSNDNYITSLSISNFEIDDNQEIYYLNPVNFGNSELNFDDRINDNILNFNVINSSNKDNSQNYNIPIFFQDCSNPITLRFVNNLADNYKVANENALTYNGSLLNELGINLDELNMNFSFDLEIITKDGEKHKNKIKLDIPIKSSEGSILDGDFEVEINENISI